MLDFKISFDSLQNLRILIGAGWSSLVARRAHNPKVVGSNPAPATKYIIKASSIKLFGAFLYLLLKARVHAAYRSFTDGLATALSRTKSSFNTLYPQRPSVISPTITPR